jgi:ferredoxin-type protein NapF
MSIDYQKRAFFMTGRSATVNKDVHLPWLKSAEEFLDKCTQCGECVQRCPEGIIDKGEGGYPSVNFKHGECTYCQKCTEQCPEDLFDTTQSTPWQLSIAINQNCLTEKNIVCQSCRDVCEHHAITFEYQLGSVPKPRIDDALCTRCGACVSSCPTGAINLDKVVQMTHPSPSQGGCNE